MRDRRSHSRPAVHPHRAGVSRLPRQRTAAAGNLEDARQAVSQRSSRPVLQRRGRCRHRAGDVPRRRRCGRARHLPDQRDPRPFAEGERHAQAAAARDPGRRDVRRLAVGERPHQSAARALEHAASGPIRRGQSRGAHRRLRQAPRRDPSLQTARPRALGRGRVLRLVGGQGAAIWRAATRRTSARSCAARVSAWTKARSP